MMRPFEAEAYVRGWDARLVGSARNENPWKRPYNGAWDSYRRNAWDKGWFDCNRETRFVDPRKRKRAVGQGG